jgi:hypothetical protein
MYPGSQIIRNSQTHVLHVVIRHCFSADHDGGRIIRNEGYSNPGKGVERMDQLKLFDGGVYPGGTLVSEITLAIENFRTFPLPIDMTGDYPTPNQVVPIFNLAVSV